MSRFAYVLRRLEAELASPEPWRTRTLLEIGGDLEEAYDAYRSRGLSEAESAERAAALLGVNREVAGELSGLNSPRYAGWLMRLAQRRGRWESAVATLVTVGTVAGGAVALQGGALFRTPGFALLLACALGAALLWSAGAVVVNAFGARRRAQVEERLASLRATPQRPPQAAHATRGYRGARSRLRQACLARSAALRRWRVCSVPQEASRPRWCGAVWASPWSTASSAWRCC